MVATRLFIILLLLYIGLSGVISPANLLLGGGIAASLTWVLRPQRDKLDGIELIKKTGYVFRYMYLLIIDMLQSGFVMARILLSPRLSINPGIIAIPKKGRGKMASALTAHALTVTPGELVVEIDRDGTMFVHCLDVSRFEEYESQIQQLRFQVLEHIVD